MTSHAGLRELRQDASELVRQAEAGAIITITVSGRDVAQLAPVERRRWRRWADIQQIFVGPADLAWDTDRDRIDQRPHDPFAP